MGILSCLDAYRAGHKEEQLGCYRTDIYDSAFFEVHWTADDLKGMYREMDRVRCELSGLASCQQSLSPLERVAYRVGKRSFVLGQLYSALREIC